MKVPISWLKDFVDIDMPLADLAHQLTMAGLEVEEIRKIEPESDKIIIGKITVPMNCS